MLPSAQLLQGPFGESQEGSEAFYHVPTVGDMNYFKDWPLTASVFGPVGRNLLPTPINGR